MQCDLLWAFALIFAIDSMWLFGLLF